MRRFLECFNIGKIGKSLVVAQSGRKKPSGTRDWQRFLKACLHERKYLSVSTFALILASLCEVAVPHYSSKALNAVVMTRNVKEFQASVRAMVLLGLGSSACTFLRAAFFGLAGKRIATRAWSNLFASLLTQDMAFFDSKETGELTNRLSADW